MSIKTGLWVLALGAATLYGAAQAAEAAVYTLKPGVTYAVEGEWDDSLALPVLLSYTLPTPPLDDYWQFWTITAEASGGHYHALERGSNGYPWFRCTDCFTSSMWQLLGVEQVSVSASGFTSAVSKDATQFWSSSFAVDFNVTTPDGISFVPLEPISSAVPGPIAGAGLPALAVLGGLVWARRRKAAA